MNLHFADAPSDYFSRPTHTLLFDGGTQIGTVYRSALGNPWEGGLSMDFIDGREDLKQWVRGKTRCEVKERLVALALSKESIPESSGKGETSD